MNVVETILTNAEKSVKIHVESESKEKMQKEQAERLSAIQGAYSKKKKPSES